MDTLYVRTLLNARCYSVKLEGNQKTVCEAAAESLYQFQINPYPANVENMVSS